MPTVDSTRGVVCTPAAVRPVTAADAGFLALLLPPVTGVLRSTITTRGVREAERGAEAGAAWPWPPAAGVRRAVAGVLRATEAEPSTGVPSAWEQGEQGMGVRQEATMEQRACAEPAHTAKNRMRHAEVHTPVQHTCFHSLGPEGDLLGAVLRRRCSVVHGAHLRQRGAAALGPLGAASALTATSQAG